MSIENPEYNTTYLCTKCDLKYPRPAPFVETSGECDRCGKHTGLLFFHPTSYIEHFDNLCRMNVGYYILNHDKTSHGPFKNKDELVDKLWDNHKETLKMLFKLNKRELEQQCKYGYLLENEFYDLELEDYLVEWGYLKPFKYPHTLCKYF